MSSRTERMLRMGCTGALACALDASLLMALARHSALSIGGAAFVAASVGAVVSYLLNRACVFADRGPWRPGEVACFAGVALGNAVGTASLIPLLVNAAHASFLAAKATSAALLFLCWSYPTQSRWVFRR